VVLVSRGHKLTGRYSIYYSIAVHNVRIEQRIGKPIPVTPRQFYSMRCWSFALASFEGCAPSRVVVVHYLCEARASVAALGWSHRRNNCPFIPPSCPLYFPVRDCTL
jgi:hypothetical protein